jgi:hypothetical protein
MMTEALMSTYVIAIRREAREKVAPGWESSLIGIEGLFIRGVPNAGRIQVDASDLAIEDAKRRLGDSFYIEPTNAHHRF